MALATPDGTCDVLIPKDRYDPFAVLAIVKEREREVAEPAPVWGRVVITEPGGRTVKVDTPSGCTVTPLAGLPKPRASVNLDEVLRAACEGGRASLQRSSGPDETSRT